MNIILHGAVWGLILFDVFISWTGEGMEHTIIKFTHYTKPVQFPETLTSWRNSLTEAHERQQRQILINTWFMTIYDLFWSEMHFSISFCWKFNRFVYKSLLSQTFIRTNWITLNFTLYLFQGQDVRFFKSSETLRSHTTSRVILLFQPASNFSSLNPREPHS